MADLYFPNPIAALPTPQFQEPQSNTGMVAMGSALQALSSVANNFRTKEMNVQKASQMADALEREGLTQEAGLYRAAAENYQTNFFATPEENERFNQSLLNDTLRLLTNKQEREMKAQQLQLETQYKQALIKNQLADAGLSEERLKLSRQEADIRKGELTERRAEREEDRRIRIEGQQSTTINRSINNIEQQLTRVDNTIKQVQDAYYRGEIPNEAEARKQLDDLQEQKLVLQESLNKNQLQLGALSGVEIFTPPISLNRPTLPKTKAQSDAEAVAKFRVDPDLKKIVIDKAVYEKDDAGEIIVTEGVDAYGNPFKRKVEKRPIKEGQSARLRPPGAPLAPNQEGGIGQGRGASLPRNL